MSPVIVVRELGEKLAVWDRHLFLEGTREPGCGQGLGMLRARISRAPSFAEEDWMSATGLHGAWVKRVAQRGARFHVKHTALRGLELSKTDGCALRRSDLRK